MATKYPRINKAYIKNLSELETNIDTWFTQGMAAKFFYMSTWMQNINFHAGNQWLIYDEHKRTFTIDPNLDEDEIRLTINKILPAVRMAVGKILQDRKRPIVIPTNQDEDAIEAAKVQTRALEHFRRVYRWMRMEKGVLTWSALTGKGITKQWYDKKRERVTTDVIPPFEYVVPPNVLDPDKMPWACHARFETRAWVYEQYGLKVEGSSDWGQYGVFLSAVKNVMEDGNYTGTYTQGLEDNVLVKDWWIRPCRDCPEGALVIEVNNKVVFADKNPYMKKVPSYEDVLAWDDFYWPFSEFDFFDAPYRYWPISLVEFMVDPQKWINETYSQNLENMQYSNSPTYWAQEGTVIADEVDMKPGSVNFYTGAQPPIPNNVPPFNPAVFEQVSQLDQAMSEAAGIHFFGPGSMPPGVHAAAALAIINEQDQMAIMSVSVNHENWMVDHAKKVLFLMREWGPPSFLIRIQGEEGQWEVAEFKRSTITGDEEVHIESKQELAQDKMTKFDQVIKLMTTPGDDGKPLLDTETGLRILNLEKDAGLVTPRMLNRNMQKSENEKLWNGDRVEVLQFEDHKEHMECLLEEMLTLKYKQSPDNVKSAFLTHYQEHQQMMNQNQQQSSGQVGQSEVQPQQQPMQPGMQPMNPQMMPMQPAMNPMEPSGLVANLQNSANRMQQMIHPGG